MDPTGENVEKDIVDIKKSTIGRFLLAIILIVIILYFLAGAFKGVNLGPTGNIPVEGSSFSDTGDNIIRDSEGKPYVILFSTTWCPHCQWIRDTFDSLQNEEFADQINLQHWELDTGDNTITEEVETEVPANIGILYDKYNPKGSIPTFVFGGRYLRIGNGYESQNDLNAEIEDFKFIIKELLEE